ncbi:MAG: redoxin domain-containing protein, partial [Planctomycetota bacterium]|nr:redoxin domain-containing protein [Planctomycetota bacterium]
MGAFLLSLPSSALEIGDQAPALQVSEWLNRAAGDPGRPDGRSLYALLFCVTWQADGEAALMQLERLQVKYQPRGLKCAVITREAPAKVKSRLGEATWQCAIGVDAGDATHRAYGALPIADLPLAFVIDKAGKILWRGNPLPALERIVAKAIAGSLPVEEGAQIVAAQEEVTRACRENDEAALLPALARLLRLEPDAAESHALRVQIFLRQGDAEKAAEALQAWQQGCAKSPPGLASLALFLLNQPDINARDPRRAFTAARQAYDLPSGKSEPLVFLALARVYAEVGELEKAVAILTEGRPVLS